MGKWIGVGESPPLFGNNVYVKPVVFYNDINHLAKTGVDSAELSGGAHPPPKIRAPIEILNDNRHLYSFPN